MGYQDLAYAIVTETVEEYKERKALGQGVEDLRNFFNGDWCALLLGNST